jgi:chorismate mutase
MKGRTTIKRLLWLATLALSGPLSAAGQTFLPSSESAGDALARYRQDIDVLDSKIVSLLNERARIALQIGRLRQRENIPPSSALTRQKQVLRNAMAHSAAPLSPEATRRIYEAILAEMVAMQSRDRAGQDAKKQELRTPTRRKLQFDSD